MIATPDPNLPSAAADTQRLATLHLAQAIPILMDLIRSYHHETRAPDSPDNPPRLREAARANCRKAIHLLYLITRIGEPPRTPTSRPRQSAPTTPPTSAAPEPAAPGEPRESAVPRPDSFPDARSAPTDPKPGRLRDAADGHAANESPAPERPGLPQPTLTPPTLTPPTLTQAAPPLIPRNPDRSAHALLCVAGAATPRPAVSTPITTRAPQTQARGAEHPRAVSGRHAQGASPAPPAGTRATDRNRIPQTAREFSRGALTDQSARPPPSLDSPCRAGRAA